MATMRREPALLLCAALSMLQLEAHGQKLVLKPGIDVMATATTNASPTNEAPRKDLVISVSPELSASYEGARSRIDGRIRVDNVHYVRNSQPDRSLPDGELVLRSNLVDQWGGLDASVQTHQITNPLDPSRFPDSYTSTTARLVPFIQHSFDANTRLKAQLERAVIDASEEGIATQYFSRQSVRLERLPTPIGTWLEWKAEDTEVSSASIDQRTAARTGLSYALDDELFTGLILGRGTAKYPAGQRETETIRGLMLSWHPSERINLNAKVEKRFFGTGWKLDWNHRTKLFAWSITSERDASTYAATADNLGSFNPAERLTPEDPAMSTPGDQARAELARRQLAPLQALYSLTPTLRQTLQGRFVLMGQRNTASLTGGVDKSGPVSQGVASSTADQMRFLELQFTRLLTPSTTLGTGVRWRQSNVTTNLGLPGNLLPIGRSRDVTWRGDIVTRLSPHASATFGLRHQIVDSTQLNASDESAMFIGVGYRY